MRSLTLQLGGPTHVGDFGGEGRPIVLIHGLGGSHVNWLAVGSLLSRYGRVYAPDLIGFGETPPAGRSTTVVSNRNLIRLFLREHVRQPAVLVGNSMGGFLSLLVAAREPALVEGLVLVCSALPRDLRTKLDPKVTGLFALYLLPGVAEAFLQWHYRRLGPEGVLQEVLDLCAVDSRRIPPDIYQAHLDMARQRYQVDYARAVFLEAARSLVPLLWRRRRLDALIRRVQVPALIIQGENDRLVSVETARRVAAVRPDWTLVVLEDIGHVPQLDNPGLFVRVVGPWIEALAKGGARSLTWSGERADSQHDLRMP